MVALRTMSESEFQIYEQHGIKSYAAEKVKAEKISLTDAMKLAHDEYR